MKLLTLGTFDTPHMGHAAFLERCRLYSDRVIVGLNSDAFVERFKGARPLFSYEEREGLLLALGFVEVLMNDGPGRDLIRDVAPDVIAIGSDWRRKDYLGQIAMTNDELDVMDCCLLYVPYTPGISTTILKARC